MKIEREPFPDIMRSLNIGGCVLGNSQVLVLDSGRDKSKPLRVVQADDFIQAIDHLGAGSVIPRIPLYTLSDILKMSKSQV